MKTFNEKDLITWSNRHKAKIKTSGYCANSIKELKENIKNNITRMLSSISDDSERCFNCCSLADYDVLKYGFFLPKEAVKEEKTYRACRNVKELYELVFNTKSKADTEFYINELVGTIIHFRLKGFDTTLYECITGIAVYNNGDIAVHIDGCNFELYELFKDYEIEINGEWQPFGVLEE